MNNLATVLVALLDRFVKCGIQENWSDCIYLIILYDSDSITCFTSYTCYSSQSIRSLGHFLDMLDHIWPENGPKA
jgi:hypothetical protein